MYICMILYDHVCIFVMCIHIITCINMKIDIHIINVDMTIYIYTYKCKYEYEN